MKGVFQIFVGPFQFLDFQFEVPASGHFTEENVDAEKHPDIETQGKRVKNEFKHGPSGRGVSNELGIQFLKKNMLKKPKKL